LYSNITQTDPAFSRKNNATRKISFLALERSVCSEHANKELMKAAAKLKMWVKQARKDRFSYVPARRLMFMTGVYF